MSTAPGAPLRGDRDRSSARIETSQGPAIGFFVSRLIIAVRPQLGCTRTLWTKSLSGASPALKNPIGQTFIRHCGLIVHRVQPAYIHCYGGWPCATFRPAKNEGFRLVGVSQGIGNGSLACIATVGKRRRKRRSSPGAITLSPRENRFLVLASLALVVVAISVGLAFCGAWLVLPFAGLDFLVVAFAFRNVERHAGDDECMIVRGDQLVIERWARGLQQNRAQPQLGEDGFQGAPGSGKRQVVIAISWKRSGVRHPFNRRAARRRGAPPERTPENPLIQGTRLGEA